MVEFEIAGQAYRADKLNAFQQLHVARRIAPVMGAAITPELIASFKSAASEPEGTAALDGLSLFEPLAKAFGAMSDADVEFITKTCLGAVSRQQGPGWQRVMTASGQLMFQDLELPAMLQITWKVIEDNLKGFFPTSAPASAQADQ